MGLTIEEKIARLERVAALALRDYGFGTQPHMGDSVEDREELNSFVDDVLVSKTDETPEADPR